MSEREALEKAVAALEAQRATLGDAVVDAAIAALRRQMLISQPRPSEERKRVTVLFADLVGFTSLAERMDPEEVHEVLEAYFGLWKTAMARHEGMVEKFIGDAVVAVFGLPLAREDAPRQAVSAALEVREAMDELNRELGRRRGLRLAMRVGIHSGPVLVRYEESGFTVTGDTVNLAARLEQAAPAGGILISHETFQQVRGLFEVRPLEPFPVKGKAMSVRAYLVYGPQRATFWPAGRGLEGLETPMVGRERELAALQEAFHAVASGPEARLLIVVGEAGVGKTRLLRELERYLRGLSTPLTFLYARAVSETASTPYALLHHLFSLHFDILESDDATAVQAKFLRGMNVLPAERALLVGQLAGFDFSALPPVQALLGSPSFLPEALADLIRFFRSLCASSPTLIFLEDLHWADNPSLNLFLRLSRELSGPLLILGSARPDLLERRPDLSAAGNLLHLHPLPPRLCRALAEEILRRVEDLSPDLTEFLAGQSGGNPFFLEELVRMLIEEEVIVPGAGRWQVRAPSLEERHVPSTLTALLQARLDALPPAEKALLQKASVAGQNFWDGLLRSLGGEGEDIAALLENLAAREIILPQERSAFAGTREYAFRHALLREVCYETVLLRERRDVHRRVAEWLEEQAGRRSGEYAGLIGEHYERAGERERAALWLQRAGEAALRTSAFPEAVAAFERALALVSPTGPERRPEELERQVALSIHLGKAWEQWGNSTEAERHFRAGLTLARAMGWRTWVAEALCGLLQLAIRRGDYAEAYPLGEEALALSRQAGEHAITATVLRRLGASAFYQGDFQGARGYLEEALALEEAGGNRLGMAICLNTLGHIELARGDHAAAASYYERALALCREVGNRRGIAASLNSLGSISFYQGDYATALKHYEDALAVSREIDDRQGIAFALLGLGWVNLWLGEYARAAQFSEESLVLFREMGERQNVASCLNNLGHAAAGLGQDEEARRYYREALACAWEIEALPVVLEAVAGLAGWLARAGRHRRAAELLGLALYHPATFPDVDKVVGPVLEFLRARMPAEALETALEEGKYLDLEETIRELLAE
ncbi:MAG: ATP-binding protein [Chloroflexia bacterium]